MNPTTAKSAAADEPDRQRPDDPERDRVGRERPAPAVDGLDAGAADRRRGEGVGDGRAPRHRPTASHHSSDGLDGVVALEPQQRQRRQVHQRDRLAGSVPGNARTEPVTRTVRRTPPIVSGTSSPTWLADRLEERVRRHDRDRTIGRVRPAMPGRTSGPAPRPHAVDAGQERQARRTGLGGEIAVSQEPRDDLVRTAEERRRAPPARSQGRATPAATSPSEPAAASVPTVSVASVAR